MFTLLTILLAAPPLSAQSGPEPGATRSNTRPQRSKAKAKAKAKVKGGKAARPGAGRGKSKGKGKGKGKSGGKGSTSPDRRQARGEQLIRGLRQDMIAGQYQAALDGLHQARALRGDSTELTLLEATILWAGGDCGAALELALPAQDNWNSRHALQAASCAWRTGQPAEAVYWQEWAGPLSTRQLAHLAWYRYAAGDPWGSDRALGELDDPELDQQLQARAALLAGDLAVLEPLLWELSRSAELLPLALELEARLELDLGNPAAALALSQRALRLNPGHQGARAVAVEAARRNGHFQQARSLLRGDPVQGRHLAMLSSRVRLLHDLGEQERAAELLQRLLDLAPLEPTVLATAWYLQPQRDLAGSAAQAYQRVQTSPLRTLDLLLPPGAP